MPLVEFLFHCFPVENTENDLAKNWKSLAYSRLTGGMRTTPDLFGTLVFLALFGASPRRVSSQPVEIAL
jgi:hypothetical protein